MARTVLAPILPVTADELWALPPAAPDRGASVHIAMFQRIERLLTARSTVDVCAPFATM
jgi:hypothetical protein